MPENELNLFDVRAKGKEIAQFIVQSKKNTNPRRAVQFVVRVIYKELRKAGFPPEHCMDIAICIMDEIAKDIEKEIKAKEKADDAQFKKEADEEFERTITGEPQAEPEA